ncbi:MAG: recombinase, partial [Pseudomonadota bacterium]
MARYTHKIWEKGDFHHRKLVLKLAFAKDIPYCRKEGFRTPKITLPFKALASFSGDKKEMAGRMGFEPTRP